MISSIAIANYFIKKSLDTATELTPMKLVKLVYISHGWNLGLKGEPLINEAVQAWKYGPVVKSVYQAFKKYGSEQVTSLETEFVGNSLITPCASEEETPLLDKIWDVYGKMNGIQLSSLTHQPGTPWDIIWHRQGGNIVSGKQIPNDLIKQHYLEKIASND
jgi:uncharacterized phage-associated protein